MQTLVRYWIITRSDPALQFVDLLAFTKASFERFSETFSWQVFLISSLRLQILWKIVFESPWKVFLFCFSIIQEFIFKVLLLSQVLHRFSTGWLQTRWGAFEKIIESSKRLNGIETAKRIWCLIHIFSVTWSSSRTTQSGSRIDINFFIFSPHHCTE